MLSFYHSIEKVIQMDFHIQFDIEAPPRLSTHM